MKTFEELQANLGGVWSLNQPGSGVDHVVVVLPSFSMGESLLSHYATRIPALEHRYLVTSLMLHRIEACELVFLTCQAPGRRVLDYYASLAPWGRRDSARNRFRVAVVPDDSARPIAAKLLDRPDLIEALRESFAGRPAFIEPWNVTQREVELAEQLRVPIDGTAPHLWPLGFKSSGRRLFKEAGVPLPVGREDIRTVRRGGGARHPRAGARRRQRPGVHRLPLPCRSDLRVGAGPIRAGDRRAPRPTRRHRAAQHGERVQLHDDQASVVDSDRESSPVQEGTCSYSGGGAYKYC
jgi:hypothetical protein